MHVRISRIRFRSWAIKIFAVVALAGIAARVFLFPHASEAAWFDDSYAYRQKITIGNTGSADSNKKIKLDIDTATLIAAGKMRSDCADTRFTDGNGKLMRYYLDAANGACNTNSTDYYVLIPTINGSSNATNVYMYYGYGSAAPGTQQSQLAVATFSPTSGPTFASEEQGDGPVLYLKLDGGGGEYVYDSSKHNNTGFSVNAVWNHDGCHEGGCFDAGSAGGYAYVSTPEHPELAFGTDGFSVSIWARHPKAISSQEDLFSKWTWGGRGQLANGVQMYMDASGAYCAMIQDQSGNSDDTICSSGTYADNLWHNIQFVKDGISSITLYVDGAEVATDASIASNGVIGDVPIYVSIGNLMGDGNSNEYKWTGYLDELKIYRYAKSASQVKLLYASKDSGSATVLGASNQSFMSNGLIGYWKLDENSGTSTADSSGNGYTGTLTNSPAWSAQGRFGTAVSFDGASASNSDVVELGDQAAFELSTFTISGWVYRTGACSFSICPIFSKGMSGNSGYSLEVADVGGTYKATLNIGDGNQVVAGTTTIAANTWYHVAATINGNRIRVYVNGNLEADEAQTQTSSFGTEPAKIGNRNDNNDVTFNGRIDEVRVYNRELSSTEVRALSENSAGPVGWWKLDEKSGTSALDSSGNGYTGTLTNGPLWSTGKVGGALTFDNSDDYVTMGDNIDLSTKNFTIMAWAKRVDHSSGDVIVAKKNGAGSGNNGYAIYCGTGSTCTTYIADGTSEFTVSGSIGTAGEWHHVAVVVDRSGNSATKFYSDGIDTTTSRAGTISTLGSLGTTASLRIGRYSNSTFPFNGQIDNVKIYDYPLTQKQIISEMNSGHPAVGSPISSAIGYWKFDEGADNTCSGGTNDTCNSGSAGNVIDGAQTNMAVPGTSTSGRTSNGKIGKAMIFDGSNDRVDMGTSSTLNITGQNMTFAAWVKRASSSQQGVLVGRGSAGASGYAIGIGNIQGAGCSTNQIAIGKFGVSWGCLSSFPADTSWHHLVVAMDSSGERAYIDGALIASNTDTGSIVTSSNNFRLGIGTDGASLFAGSMDEVKVYNYDLSADDVKTEYNQGKVQVLGSVSTESDGTTASTSTSREYCIPGESSGTCTYPVNQWSFDEGTGTTAYDTGTSPLNATLANGTSWATGKVGKSLSFDGCSGCSQDDNASVSSHTLPTVMTIEAWVYPKTTGEGGLGRLLDNGSDIILFLNSSNANRLEFSSIWSTTNGNWYMTPALTYNQWSHVVVTYDYGSTSNTPTFYVNGIRQTTNTGSSSPSGTHSLTAHTTYIGNNSSGSRTWDGYIDNVKIFNYARNAAQIAWDYNHGGPVGRWKFDECQGITAYDASGNGNNGTISAGNSSGDNDTAGTCNSGTTTEMWNDGSTGKYNSALGLDGTNDQVNVAANNVFNITSDITISAWIKRGGTTHSWSAEDILVKTNNTNWDYEFGIDASGGTNDALFFYGDGLSPTYRYSTGTIADTTTWHHVVVTRSGSTVTFYIDGMPSGSSSQANNFNSNSVPVNIGSCGVTCNQNYLNGLLDDVRVYNYALNSTQVKTVYNEGSAIRFGPNTGAP